MVSALVVGAGVAGPVSAMALQRAGVGAVVVDAHPNGAAEDIGAFLTLQVNGIDALRAIDADGVIADRAFATPAMRIRSRTGRVLGTVSTGAPLPDGTVGLTIRRSDLYLALRDEALRRGIPITYGRRLVSAATDDRQVRAVFDDGSVERADLLIGADGIRSTVRRLIDPAAPPARFVSLLNLGGYAPPQATDAEPGEYEMIFGRRCFFGYVVAPSGGVWWFANPPRRDEPARGELAATSDATWRALLDDLLADDAGPGRALVRSTPHPLVGWATYDVPRVPRWHRDRMVIIGDAAHATSPSSGQGASLAIEDAVELARCLRDLPEVEAAFVAYEQLRRARVQRVVAHGARTSNTKVAGPVKRVILDALMPLVLRKVAGDGGASLTWMHRHHIDWSAPVTPTAAMHRG